MKRFFKLFMSYIILTTACNIGTVSVYAESNNIDSTETTEIFTEESQVTETEVTDKAETSDNEVYANGEEVQPAAEGDGTEELQVAGTETLDNEVYEDGGEIQLAAAVTVEGEGTEESPYIITNEQQLFTMAMGNEKFPLDAYYVLNNDISFKSKNWTPIGLNSTTEKTGFRGNFDGKGHKISNLNISNTVSGSNYGLFYSNAGTISNLTVEAGTISGSDKYIGIIAATNSGTITNCTVSGEISGYIPGYLGSDKYNTYGIGGITGINNGTITKCRSSHTFTDTTTSTSANEYHGCIGGIAGGCNSEGMISDCMFSGALKGSYVKYLGGITGYSEKDITNCDCSASIEGGNVHYAGGIVGREKGSISDCNFTGTITEVGIKMYSYPINSNSKKNESGIGGIAGYVLGDISDCMNTGEAVNVTGAYYSGGIAGYSEGNVSNCVNSAGINSSLRYVGGIIGYSKMAITNCTNMGAITSGSCYHRTGGIAGYAGGNVSNCYNNNSIENSGYTSDDYTGGLIGYAEKGAVSNCFNKGNIKGSYRTGGLIGHNSDSVDDCYSIGNVEGGNGFIGTNESSEYITNCYCAGTVTGSEPFSGSGKYYNCVYNKTISKLESSASGAYGLTTEEMKDVATVEDNYVFWDFDEVWGIDSKINSGYPYLLSSVTKMKLSETNMQLVVGDSRKIIPLTPGLSNIKWSSSDDGIASVDSEGNVTANGVGSTVITASVNDGLYTASCTVLVVTEDDLEDSALFIVDSVTEALPGEKISVPVRLTKNSKGICSMGVDISYDKSILKFAELKEGDLFDNTTSNTNYGDNIVRIASSSSSNITGVGVLCYLEFEVAEDAQKGSTELNIKVDELKTLVGVNQTNLPYTTTNGTVIIDEFYMLGDVDNNGIISPSDATEVLLYYINEKDFNLKQKKAADVNKDNEVTPIDAAFILKKYVNPNFEF